MAVLRYILIVLRKYGKGENGRFTILRFSTTFAVYLKRIFAQIYTVGNSIPFHSIPFQAYYSMGRFLNFGGKIGRADGLLGRARAQRHHGVRQARRGCQRKRAEFGRRAGVGRRDQLKVQPAPAHPEEERREQRLKQEEINETERNEIPFSIFFSMKNFNYVIIFIFYVDRLFDISS